MSNMDSVFKKNNGVYYTNSRLANKLISYLKIDYCGVPNTCKSNDVNCS